MLTAETTRLRTEAAGLKKELAPTKAQLRPASAIVHNQESGSPIAPSVAIIKVDTVPPGISPIPFSSTIQIAGYNYDLLLSSFRGKINGTTSDHNLV